MGDNPERASHMGFDRKIDSLSRTLEALEMRRQGFSYLQIARKLGYSYASGAEKAVRRALKYVIREPAEAVRKMELDRLDEMLRSIWERVKKGDLLAMDRALRIEERRAKLLGLDTIAEKTDKPLVIRVIEGTGMDGLDSGGSLPSSSIEQAQSGMDFEEGEELPLDETEEPPKQGLLPGILSEPLEKDDLD